MPIEQSFFNSPLGILEIKVTAQLVWSILFTNTNRKIIPITENITKIQSKYPLTMICQQQLTEYFSGERTVFELPLQQKGTVFQQKIWSELTNIPFGKTAEEIILDHLKDYTFPTCFGFPSGHLDDNRSIRLGVSSVLDINENGVSLSQF